MISLINKSVIYCINSFFVSAFSALADNALVTVSAVSSIMGLAMSKTSRGLELKNAAAASAEKNM